ncbi:13860_t:CDS:1, partial [Gigaspora rosea]
EVEHRKPTSEPAWAFDPPRGLMIIKLFFARSSALSLSFSNLAI